MKKYSEEHLESVPPEFIAALEKTLEMVKDGICTSSSCPDVIQSKDIDNYICTDENALCPKYIKYRVNFGSPCPCWKYGKNKSAKMIENLIIQWKAWAQVTD